MLATLADYQPADHAGVTSLEESNNLNFLLRISEAGPCLDGYVLTATDQEAATSTDYEASSEVTWTLNKFTMDPDYCPVEYTS